MFTCLLLSRGDLYTERCCLGLNLVTLKLKLTQNAQRLKSESLCCEVRSVRFSQCCQSPHWNNRKWSLLLLWFPVNYHHWSQLWGPGIRGHPAQHGWGKCGGGHLHCHRWCHLQPGVHIWLKDQNSRGRRLHDRCVTFRTGPPALSGRTNVQTALTDSWTSQVCVPVKLK